jgi:hypothetical protein
MPVTERASHKPRSIDTHPGDGWAADKARLRRLLALWEAKRAGRRLPARADFDPLELKEHLSSLFITEVLPDGDFRYRLIGTAVTRAMRRDITGHRVSESYLEPDAKPLLALYRKICARREPLWRAGRMRWNDEDYNLFEAVFLPLGADGETVDQVLASISFSAETNDAVEALRALGGAQQHAP